METQYSPSAENVIIKERMMGRHLRAASRKLQAPSRGSVSEEGENGYESAAKMITKMFSDLNMSNHMSLMQQLRAPRKQMSDRSK